MVVGQGLKLVAIGLLVGGAASYAGARAVGSFLYQTNHKRALCRRSLSRRRARPEGGRPSARRASGVDVDQHRNQ